MFGMLVCHTVLPYVEGLVLRRDFGFSMSDSLPSSSLAALTAAAFSVAWLSGRPEVVGGPSVLTHELECAAELGKLFEVQQSLDWWRRAAAALCLVVACCLSWTLWRTRIIGFGAAASPQAFASATVHVARSEVPRIPAPPLRSRRSRDGGSGGVLETRSEGVPPVQGPRDLA